MTAGTFDGGEDARFQTGSFFNSIGLAVPAPKFEEILQVHMDAAGHPDVGPYACLVGEVIDLHGMNPPRTAQIIMSAEHCAVLLGALQAFAERAARVRPVGRVDQLDALRADAKARWATNIAARGV